MHVCVLAFPPPPKTPIAHPITHTLPTPKPTRPPGSTNTQLYKYYSNEQLCYGNSNLIYQNCRKYCVIKSLVLHVLCYSLRLFCPPPLVMHVLWLVLHVLRLFHPPSLHVVCFSLSWLRTFGTI